MVVNNPYIGAEHKCYFVKINPNTFEVNYTGLNFNQTASISTFLNGTKLYSSYNSGDTFEIDVENNTAKKVLLNNSSFTFSKAAFYSNDIAYFLKKKTTTEGGVTISKMNLIDNTSEDLFSNESLGVSPPNGSGFIDKSTNEYVCYMLKDGFFVLVKFSILNKTYKYIKLTSDISIDNNLIIIDKVNI
ncbi:hypothetical protein D3C85_993480 [compost metagenome]